MISPLSTQKGRKPRQEILACIAFIKEMREADDPSIYNRDEGGIVLFLPLSNKKDKSIDILVQMNYIGFMNCIIVYKLNKEDRIGRIIFDSTQISLLHQVPPVEIHR